MYNRVPRRSYRDRSESLDPVSQEQYDKAAKAQYTQEQINNAPFFREEGQCQCDQCGLTIRSCEFCNKKLSRDDHHDEICDDFKIKTLLRQSAYFKNKKLLETTFHNYLKGRSIYGWNIEGVWSGDDLDVPRVKFEWAMENLRVLARHPTIYGRKYVH